MFFEFNRGTKLTTLGPVADVTITLDVFTKFGYEPFQFGIDTGSDFTILPKYMAIEIGIDLSHCETTLAYGISSEPLKAYIASIMIKIAKMELPVRCLITERNDTPLLLGRMDIFDKFNITFDNTRLKIVFTPFDTK